LGSLVPRPSQEAEEGLVIWGLLHRPVYKSSGWPQSLFGHPKTGCEIRFNYLQFTLKAVQRS